MLTATIDTTTHFQQLRDSIAHWVTLDDDQWQRLSTIFQRKNVDDRDHILLPGDRVHQLVFVCSGLLRFYYMTEDGAESNKAFIAENTFAGPLAAFSLDLPVIYGVQALEPTEILFADYADFVALFDEHPVFDRLGRRLAEWLLMRKELRTRSLLQKQAKERYLDFLRQHADLAERVPQYHIASYLGITEVSLSRLRRTLIDPS